MKSTELRRFVFTRPIQIPAQGLPTQPPADSPAGPITYLDQTASVFWPSPAGAGGPPANAWNVSSATLAAFARGSDYLVSGAAIAARQPGLDAFARTLATHRKSDPFSNALSAFEKNTKQSLQEFAKRTGLRTNLRVFWDNLIYRSVTKSGLDSVPALADAIRLSALLQGAADDPNSMRRFAVGTAMTATIALPREIYDLHVLQPDDLCVAPPSSPPCDGTVSEPWPNTRGDVQPLGWGDLKIIKSSLLRYATGEIAHVENILAGEEHVRIFRDLRRTETKEERETENQSELTSSLESTEKFSFEQEVAKATTQSTDVKAGLSASLEYGAVETGLAKANGYLDLQNKSGKEESQKSATKYAKEVVSSATAKLTQRVRALQSITTTNEKENKTKHAFRNPSPVHRSGVYRWLDKYYLAHVENYGQRFMYEFAVPEPAAFFRHAKTKREAAGPRPPVAPAEFPMPVRNVNGQPLPGQFQPLTDFSILTRSNYQHWLALYGATSATPPPPPQKHVDWVQSGGRPQMWHLNYASGEIEVPENYVAKRAYIVAICANGGWVKILIDDQYFDTAPAFSNSPRTLPDRVGKIPVSLIATDTYNANVTIECELSAGGFDAWRIATFDAIMQGYARQLAGYEERVQQAAQERSAASFGVNPGINRQVEQTELKKSCLELITGQRFESIDAMRDTPAPTATPPERLGYPEFSFSEAAREGNYIQFFEKAFEWTNMTYTFAPYFWGRKEGWLDVLDLADGDPLFESFLRAGSARVVVPVRPGYEKDVLDFFSFGWDGMRQPLITIDDPRYVSIVEELKEQAGLFPGKRIEPERWVVKVPTTLVFLESSGEPLPDYTKQLWWQPRLRVIVVDSSASPIPGAQVTLRYMNAAGVPQPPLILGGPNGPSPDAYDFLLDEGTYKIEAVEVVDVAGTPAWLPSPGTAVVEVFQDTEVAITLWRLTVTVEDANALPIPNATVTVSGQGLGGSAQVQLTAANGSAPGTYLFMVNPGTYRIDVLGPGSGNPVTTNASAVADTAVTVSV